MDLDTIRRDLERVLQETAEHHQQLNLREQELAAAMELLSVDDRVRSAYHQGEADALQRVQQLIQLQLDNLPHTSSARVVLKTLRRLMGGVG